jgi:hypothetical protein
MGHKARPIVLVRFSQVLFETAKAVKFIGLTLVLWRTSKWMPKHSKDNLGDFKSKSYFYRVTDLPGLKTWKVCTKENELKKRTCRDTKPFISPHHFPA